MSSRRKFLAQAAAVGALTGGLKALNPATAQAAQGEVPQERQASPMSDQRQRPNILWIQTDEQRPDSLGCYGSSWARTPNLDRLAADGVIFTQCHVQSPVCVSSRTSMLTGQYPQEVGVYNNAPAFKDGFLDAQTPTFVNLLRDVGYHTVNYGKWHTPNHPTWDDNKLFHIFPQACDYFGLNPQFSEEEYRVVKLPWPNSTTIVGGRYPHHDWGINTASHVTDVGILKMRDLAQRDQPFMLRLSYVWPHTPVLPPTPWDTMFKPEDVPNHAANREAAYAARAQYDRDYADLQGAMQISLETWRQCAADYHALCSLIDFEVGRLMQELDRLGLRENTIIAFNSDHGCSLGEAGLSQKGFYDHEVWRVPFLLSCPGLLPQGEVREENMELMDFGSTLCALAGAEMGEGMRGRDLFNSEPSEAVFGIIDLMGTLRAGVRVGNYRYDCSLRRDRKPVGEDECDPNLFDVVNDPEGLRNLARDPGHAALASEMYGRIREWIGQTKPNLIA